MSQNMLDDPSDKDVQMPSMRQREYRQAKPDGVDFGVFTYSHSAKEHVLDDMTPVLCPKLFNGQVLMTGPGMYKIEYLGELHTRYTSVQGIYGSVNELIDYHVITV